MTYRVIQWATGGVGRAAIEGIADHPELELVGCWVHRPDEGRARRRRDRRHARRSASRATDDVDALLALDADCVLYSPLLAKPDEVVRILESGKNVVTPLGWFYPVPQRRASRRCEAACRDGRRHAARHRHPPRRHHRALPADGLGALARDHARARRGVLRHPHLRRRRRRARHHAVRQDAGGGGARARCCRFLGAGFGQSIDMVADALGFALDRAEAHARTRWRSRPRRSTRRSAPIAPGPRRRAALHLAGHSCAASPSSPCASTG